MIGLQSEIRTIALISHTVKFVVLLTIPLLCMPSYADAVDDATADDIASLCNNSPANSLSKIVNKKSNPEDMRRTAMRRMIEVSRSCSDASDQRLTQFHHQMINAAHKMLDLSEVESRRAAIDSFQYVIMQPDTAQPPQGSITRGQTIANLALSDSDVNIRLWALEALVTLRGDDTTVHNTLSGATLDPEVIIQQTAINMLFELFPSP